MKFRLHMPEKKDSTEIAAPAAKPDHPPHHPMAGPPAVGATVLIFVALVIGLFFVDVVKQNLGLDESPVTLGATFSKPYAESLGLDWKAAYTATLDDLGVRHLRIPAYWDDIEPQDGVWNFSNVDWQISEASKRNATVILAIGRKLPRWPECHAPTWTAGMQESLVQTRILTMLEEVVRRYKNNPTIVEWQVENEPFFQFGNCPPPNRDFLEREVAVVHALDSRPVMITESGELSSWIQVAGIADVLGISTYRTVWSKYFGYFYWPITPRYYVEKFSAISSLVDKAIISELQAEPWAPNGINSLPLDQQLSLMNPGQLDENVSFVRKIGFPEAYLWGVEWWYWLKTQKGHPELWEEGKRLFAMPPPKPLTWVIK